MFLRKTAVAVSAALFTLALAGCNSSSTTTSTSASTTTTPLGSTVGVTAVADGLTTSTPIKHVVVIYNENVSFDHYFGTYPTASGFSAAAKTQSVNGLVPNSVNGNVDYLNNNPNSTNTANNATTLTGTSIATNPFLLLRSQAATQDQNHAYTAEEQAYDNGAADLFPLYTSNNKTTSTVLYGTPSLVMGYYDGTTVTAMWNYAQNFAMSDNAFTDTYGPSTPGALEAVSGQTNGMQIVATTKAPFTLSSYSYYIKDGQGGYTMINDVDPAADVCSSTKDQVWMTGKNVGDLLNDADITWGSFMGGFDLSTINDNGSTNCSRSTYSTTVSSTVTDYIPHHAWFQYYQSTSNPTHARPSSTDAVGYSYEANGSTKDPANHEYDVDDFFAAVKAGNYPAVSYIKAPAYQDGHAGYSDPLDEQAFTAKVVNFLMTQPDWKNTAVIVSWDDSDGWYDHAYANPTSPSFDAQADQLNGSGKCGTGTAPNGVNGKPVNGRCGPGTRIPFIVISPYAKVNYVSHTAISQASIVKFIEDNWLSGKRLGGGSFDATSGSINDMFDFTAAPHTTPVLINPVTGTVL